MIEFSFVFESPYVYDAMVAFLIALTLYLLIKTITEILKIIQMWLQWKINKIKARPGQTPST